MKKTCFCFILVLFCVFSLSAWSLFQLSPSRPECVTDEFNELLEQKHFEQDSDAIIGFTKNFSLADRQAIYDYYQIDGEKAADDNFMGIGSFIQGDSKGGAIMLASDIVFWGTGLTGTIMFCVGMCDVFGIAAPAYTVAGQAGYNAERAKTLMLGGLATMTVGVVGGVLMDFIYGNIRPHNYANTQNAALKSALGLDSTDAQVSLQPVANPVTMNYGLSLAIRM